MKTLCTAIAVVLVGALVAGTLLLLRGGISAKPEPTGIEAAIAGKLRRWGIPGSWRQLRNPVSPSDEALAKGRAHFADHCAMCHANDGSGQTEMGRNLYPRAPDMRKAETQQLSDGELFYIIENGVRLTGMPGWSDGSEGSKRASWQLVTFIRHLPQLTEKEKLEMERLNPKSPDEWRELKEDEEFLEGEQPAETHGQPSHAHHH